MAVAVGLAMMGGIATAVTASATEDKVVVCKYVSSPGDETPQPADGVISVSTNTLKGFEGEFPFWFADAQGPSMAFGWDPPGAEVADCPVINPPETHTALLTLVKSVNNDAGGTATASDWTLDATGGPTAFAEGASGVDQQVADGTYTLSELPAATTNYTASDWDCTNTTVNGTTVVIGPTDESVTCTITNTFNPPEPHTALLTLVKSVNDDAGGTATASDWTLDATGGPTAFAEGTTPVSSEVADGTYTLSELPAATTNYSPSAWDCTNTEENDTTVVIGPNDESVTCTITNTFEPLAELKAISVVKTATLHDTINAANTAGKADAGETITYSFLVTNTGDVPLTGVAVTDSKLASPVTCDPTALAPDAQVTCTAPAYLVTAADVAAGKPIINVATASGQPPMGSRVTATSTVSTPSQEPAVVAGVVADAPVVAGVVKNAPVVAGVVKSAPVKTLAFTGAETVPLGLSGLIALVLGAVLTVASRRQRPKQARE